MPQKDMLASFSYLLSCFFFSLSTLSTEGQLLTLTHRISESETFQRHVSLRQPWERLLASG